MALAICVTYGAQTRTPNSIASILMNFYAFQV
jgi:hypothetical protein